MTLRSKEFKDAHLHSILKSEISNGRVIEKKVSASLVKLLHGSRQQD